MSAPELNHDGTAPVVYHPDPEINRGIREEMLVAETFDVSVGYPPRAWRCPECRATHRRGWFGAVKSHRCLGCGYQGAGGVMFGTGPQQ